jgi:fimbrial isopeptide formation D2 family protein/LPXTG-motif cell wall-anchored protein
MSASRLRIDPVMRPTNAGVSFLRIADIEMVKRTTGNDNTSLAVLPRERKQVNQMTISTFGKAFRKGGTVLSATLLAAGLALGGLAVSPAFADGNTGGWGVSVDVPTLLASCDAQGEIALPGDLISPDKLTTFDTANGLVYHTSVSGDTAIVSVYGAAPLEGADYSAFYDAEGNPVAELANLSDADIAAYEASGVLYYTGTDPYTFNVAPAECANIDFSKTGSLSITKYADNGTRTDNTTGEAGQDSGTTATPLEGVEFTITPITDIDLTDFTQWDGLSTLTAEQALTHELGTPQTATTDADGKATLTDLPLGVYVVQETGHGDNNIVASVAPFVVVLPRSLGGGEWNYDVSVFPKNSVVAVDKEAQIPAHAGLGANLGWTVSSTIPQGAEAITALGFTDALDSRLSYVEGSATVKVGDTEIPATATVESGNQLTVAVDQEGLATLEEHRGEDAVLSFKTTVSDLGENGVIDNRAYAYFNDPDNRIESDVATAKLGALSIKKVAENDEAKSLDDAKFQVFASEEDAKSGTNPIAVEGETTFTTEGGVATIDGLTVGNEDDSEATYFIKEIAAPAGYILNSTPIEVKVVPSGVSSAKVITVSNAQQPSGKLPQTGASGTLLVAGAALLLTGAGIVLFVRARREEKTV